MTIYRMVNGGKLIREASYDQITHFVASHKYVTAYYEGGDLLLDITLAQLKTNHPELVYMHRSTLIKPERIDLFWRDPDLNRYFINCAGACLPVSRRHYKHIRALVESRKELQA